MAGAGGRGRAGREAWGSVRRLPSGRWQATYPDPTAEAGPGRHRPRVSAPATFDTLTEARAWLRQESVLVGSGRWTHPAERRRAAAAAATTVGGYAEVYLATRSLAAGTLREYRRMLATRIGPALGHRPLGAVTPGEVRAWHATMAATPTESARAYGLLHALYAQAVADGVVAGSPCRVRGAQRAERRRRIRPATPDEVAAVAAAAGPPWDLVVLLAAWGALRQGEVFALARRDVDLSGDLPVLRVRAAAAYAGAGRGRVLKAPKTAAGTRDVVLPGHLRAPLAAHLDRVGADPGALLFPARGGGPLAPSTLYRHFVPAARAAGRADLTFHGLRHTGGMWAAAVGAATPDLMARLGHSTPAAALVYQHATQGADAAVAEQLGTLAATGDVVPIDALRLARGARRTDAGRPTAGRF